MPVGSNKLSQEIDVQGTLNYDQTRSLADEVAGRGATVSTGTGDTISGTAPIMTLTDSAGAFVAADKGRLITLAGASTGANNGTFLIVAVNSSTSIDYVNASGAAESFPGTWTIRKLYSLEDDLNFNRTDRKAIKGTTNATDAVPTYAVATATGTQVPASLNQTAGKTLDAVVRTVTRTKLCSATVSASDTFVIHVDTGNLKHATGADLTGVPVDQSNGSEYVIIRDGNYDRALKVSAVGANYGWNIVGKVKSSGATSPNSIKVEFYMMDGSDFATATAYTWEADQPASIELQYPFNMTALAATVSHVHTANVLRALASEPVDGDPYTAYVSKAREISGQTGIVGDKRFMFGLPQDAYDALTATPNVIEWMAETFDENLAMSTPGLTQLRGKGDCDLQGEIVGTHLLASGGTALTVDSGASIEVRDMIVESSDGVSSNFEFDGNGNTASCYLRDCTLRGSVTNAHNIVDAMDVRIDNVGIAGGRLRLTNCQNSTWHGTRHIGGTLIEPIVSIVDDAIQGTHLFMEGRYGGLLMSDGPSLSVTTNCWFQTVIMTALDDSLNSPTISFLGTAVNCNLTPTATGSFAFTGATLGNFNINDAPAPVIVLMKYARCAILTVGIDVTVDATGTPLDPSTTTLTDATSNVLNAQWVTFSPISEATNTHTATLAESTVYMDFNGARTVELPGNAMPGQRFTYTDTARVASTLGKEITINRNSGTAVDTINGATSIVIQADGASLTLEYDRDNLRFVVV